MFKIIGAASVIIAAMLYGIKKYNAFFERKWILESIRDGSIRVENVIRCMCAPLDEGFMHGGEFFISAAEKIRQGMLPSEAVRDAAAELHILKSEDLRITEGFAEGLCARDREGQLSNLRLFITALDSNIKNAASELETRGKLCVKGSILVAAAIVMLLI